MKTALVLVSAMLSGIIVAGWMRTFLPDMPRWLHTMSVFLAVRAGGDGAALLMTRQALIIYEDMITDLMVFAALALLAHLATILAEFYIGGEVSPLLLAIGAYVFLIRLPEGR